MKTKTLIYMVVMEVPPESVEVVTKHLGFAALAVAKKLNSEVTAAGPWEKWKVAFEKTAARERMSEGPPRSS